MSRSSPRRCKPAMLVPVLLMVATSTALSGCGSNAPRRMGTGTASGAATGAAFGLIGGPIGVVIGGAIGGGIGALTASNTTAKQINLDNIGKTALAPAAPAPAYGQPAYGQSAYGQSGSAVPQAGLRNQINQYQGQNQPSGYAGQPAYGAPQPLVPQGAPGAGGIQSQALPPPNTQ